MLMVTQPIWESDLHTASYDFKPALSVHHAICTVKLAGQVHDGIVYVRQT
jgi:retron-type reverse transcriptase